MGFYKDFVWGCGISDYQMEGVEIDFYHKYKEDIALMKLIGIKAFSLEINWASIFLEGNGKGDRQGITFYEKVVEELLVAGIEPYITLCHWDMSLDYCENSLWFAKYAEMIVERFSDKVKYFTTINISKWDFNFTKKGRISENFQTVQDVLRAHDEAVIAMRKVAKQDIKIGVALAGIMTYPKTHQPQDIEAARRFSFEYQKEMERVVQSLDFLGQSVDKGVMVEVGGDGEPQIVEAKEGPVTPECMFWGVKFLYERYRKPIYITENAMVSNDRIGLDGRVHDRVRVEFLNDCLLELQRAVEDGVEIMGYFSCPLLDDLYRMKEQHGGFGLVYVDYESGRRIAKDSAFWYRTVIESNGSTLMERVKKEIIFMKPVYKQMVWGGHKMEKEYSYHTPGEHTGECWAISAHERGDCVVRQGRWKGTPLSLLWKEHRELFGNMEGEEFPLIVKIIDAKEDLSIQVHPDDKYAMEKENGSLGKTECWYILDCPENGRIIVGHHGRTKEELITMMKENRWENLLCQVPIQKGDFIQINPGTIHAIKGNTMVLEIQQSSDITYRLYDYNRLVDGKLRELHVEKGMEVTEVPSLVNPICHSDKIQEMQLLVECSYYKVWKYVVKRPMTFFQKEPFLIMTVIKGNGFIDGLFIRKGDHFILPYQYGEYSLEGDMEIIASTMK